jgi:hypothetical protein
MKAPHHHVKVMVLTGMNSGMKVSSFVGAGELVADVFSRRTLEGGGQIRLD